MRRSKPGGVNCAVASCSNRSSKKTVSFFSFPKDPKRSIMWLIACNRVDLITKGSEYLHKNSKVCALHFEDKYYIQGLYRKQLQQTAVPTIFPSLEEIAEILKVRRNNNEEDSRKGSKILPEREDVSKRICRLCLEVVATGDGETIEEIKKEKLKFLLINIDFDISDNAVACNRCLEKLQDGFDFKSSCSSMDSYIRPFVYTDVKVELNNVFQTETSMENVKVETTCRLCTLPIEDESFSCTNDSVDGVVLKDMIRNCLPEVDLNTIHESLICSGCLSNTKKFNEFKKICHETEQRIQNYRQVMAGCNKVFLEDVLQFKNCDTPSEPIIIKKECPDVGYVDANIMECLKSEGTVPIKCEEVDIKDDLNIIVEASESAPKKKRRIRKRRSNEGKPHRYFCPKCPYASYEQRNVMIHMRSHKDNEVHKCFLCSFVTNARLLLSDHMRTHKGSTKTFGCCECPYETNRKHELKQHIVKHKDDSEVVMHQCKDCSFKTKLKRYLASHVLRHKKPEEVRMHKCDKCEYQARYRNYLNSHKVVHENSFKYKCETCSYQGKTSRCFKRHMLTHFEENTYRCDQCGYCSNVKKNLLSHKQVHIRESERVTLQCDQCSFQTKYKSTLKDHKIVHNPKKPTLKCDQCEYSTKQKIRFKQHLVTHMTLEEAMPYYCATCDFKTKYKTSIMGHVHTCLKRKKKNDSKCVSQSEKQECMKTAAGRLEPN